VEIPLGKHEERHMENPLDVAVLVGSLRKESFTRKLARAACGLSPGSLSCSIVEIRDLPLYDQDREDDPPAAWIAFRDRVRRADALLFVTPEYNRSIPGALKNAIDVGSRPYGKSVYDGKPGAVVSCSPGAIGGFGANHHLRQCLVFLNVPVLQREAYLGAVNKSLDDAGNLTNDSTRDFVQQYMQAFADWAARNRKQA
jgi:chromate reductase